MRFVILVPAGVRTGGPEACHQLCDTLLAQGFDASIWFLDEADLRNLQQRLQRGPSLAATGCEVGSKNATIPEYAHYRVSEFTRFQSGEMVTFVIPELFVWALPAFIGLPVLVWWLSVDNAFGALSMINLNFLRTPLVRHAAQCEYVSAFTASLGLCASPLSDYTVIPEGHRIPLVERPRRVAFNAGKKNIFDMNHLGQQLQATCPGVELIPLVNMAREQVFELFGAARLYVDLGNFPGKDRMAREALALGANVVIASAGAGSSGIDHPWPECYRLDPHRTEALAALIGHMVNHPDVHVPLFDKARENIRGERSVFQEQVLALFSTLLTPIRH